MQGLSQELTAILDYWANVVFDPGTRLFHGRVDERNVPHPQAPRGAVMYARILWAFSAACKVTGNPRDRQLAAHAFHGLLTLFRDPVYGGVYWTAGAAGRPLDDKKQVYALAFAIYGLTEYYSLTKDAQALKESIALFRLIEAHSYDPVHGGYIEAFRRNWSAAADLRLSEKDDNERKTLNTHLHIVEAYANLYRLWPDTQLANAIRHLLGLFDRYFIDRATRHLVLFFNDTWQPRSRNISYGHDIEASWLLCEAAQVLGDAAWIQRMEQLAPAMVDATLEGFDATGGLNYEYIAATRQLVREKHWWVQAEAAVGLLNAWQLTGHARYREGFDRSWDFTMRCLVDRAGGEWYWGLEQDGSPMPGQDKAGIWKCPYHNTRSLLEIMRRTATPQTAGLIP